MINTARTLQSRKNFIFRNLLIAEFVSNLRCQMLLRVAIYNMDITSDDRYNGATCFPKGHLDIVLKPSMGRKTRVVFVLLPKHLVFTRTLGSVRSSEV